MIPAELIVLETENWLVNHRLGSTYPGYLMAESRQPTKEIHELSAESLTELGPLLARIEKTLFRTYSPQKVLVAKLGFTPGFNCHFHIVPLHDWVIKAISANSAYADEPDGNDVLLYLNREYCENQDARKSLSVAMKSVTELKLARAEETVSESQAMQKFKDEQGDEKL